MYLECFDIFPNQMNTNSILQKHICLRLSKGKKIWKQVPHPILTYILDFMEYVHETP